MRIPSKSVAALALSLSVVGTTQAALVNFTLTGEVVYADVGNDFNLNGQQDDGMGGGIPGTGSLVTVVGFFDDDVLMGGLGTVDFSSGSGNSFTIYAGNYTYSNADDDFFTSGYPLLHFEGDPVPYLDFWHANMTTFLSDGAGFFNAEDANSGQLAGVWTEYNATVVPVPAAVWLFGSGLLGLVGIARRKSAA